MIFMTFADGYTDFIHSAKRLVSMAESFNVFDEIKLYTYEHLVDFEHKEFVLGNPRGFGYWIWKPYLIWKTLSEAKDGEVLLYLDARCSLHIEGRDRFLFYVDLVNCSKNGNLFFQGNPIWQEIGRLCKMDTVHYFDAEDILGERCLCAGVIFAKKNEYNLWLFKTWYEVCCNYHLLDDSPSILENASNFYRHGHDQSIFSLVNRKKGDLSGTVLLGVYDIHLPFRGGGEIYPISIHTN